MKGVSKVGWLWLSLRSYAGWVPSLFAKWTLTRTGNEWNNSFSLAKIFDRWYRAVGLAFGESDENLSRQSNHHIFHGSTLMQCCDWHFEICLQWKYEGSHKIQFKGFNTFIVNYVHKYLMVNQWILRDTSPYYFTSINGWWIEL